MLTVLYGNGFKLQKGDRIRASKPLPTTPILAIAACTMNKHGLDNGGVLDRSRSRVVEPVNQALNEPSGQGSWDLQHVSDQGGQRTSLMALLSNPHPQSHLHRVVVTHFLCLQRDGATVKAICILPGLLSINLINSRPNKFAKWWGGEKENRILKQLSNC